MLEKILSIDYSAAALDIRKLLHEMKGELAPRIVQDIPNRIYRAVVDGLGNKAGGSIYLLYIPSTKTWTFEESNLIVGSVDRVVTSSMIFVSNVSNDFLYAESYALYRADESFSILAAGQKKNELCVVIK
jgi:hypothetical protein